MSVELNIYNKARPKDNRKYFCHLFLANNLHSCKVWILLNNEHCSPQTGQPHPGHSLASARTLNKYYGCNSMLILGIYRKIGGNYNNIYL